MRTLGLLLLALCAHPAFAQSSDAPADPPSLLVSSVQFEGNTFFSNEALWARVRTRPNRRFLNLPGVTWWRWLHRLGSSGRLGRRLSQALIASGEPPALYNPSTVDADLDRLRLSYLQEGFRAATVQARLDPDSARQRVRITYTIEQGPATHIRRVVLDDGQALAEEAQRALFQASYLNLQTTASATHYRGGPGQRYSEPTLLEERQRMLTWLLDEGYAQITRDSIRALVTPVTPDSFDITFRVRPGPRIRLGGIHFAVTGAEPTRRPRTDTLDAVPTAAPVAATLHVSSRIEGDTRLRPSLLRRTLQVTPGQWYSQTALLDTKRRLEATGLFSFTNIAQLPVDSAGALLLPLRIELQSRPRHRLRFNTFILRDLLGEQELGAGLGVGVTYENLNLRGGGETLRLSTTVAADFQPSASAQVEVSGSYAVPYLLRPFRWASRVLPTYDVRTRFSLSLLAARRDELRLLIRGRGNARLRYEIQHDPVRTSFLDVLDLSVSNPDTLSGFQEFFLNDILQRVADPVQQAQILEDYTNPQVNNAARYTFRSVAGDPLRRLDGYSREISLEVGGNLPYVLDRLVFTPDSLEGTIPGLPLFQGIGTGNRLLYRRYLRLVADARQYRPMGPGTVLAWKGLVGLAHPVGVAGVVPFDRRFYSGGGASVRGWTLRSLGPGGAEPDTSGTSTNLLGG
ncbi:MAG: POTRA domain-containing protein, partial [Bacteroidota bacterium]